MTISEASNSSGDQHHLESADNGDRKPATLRDQLRKPRTWLSFIIAGVLLAVFVLTTDIDLHQVLDAAKAADRTDLLIAIAIYYGSIVLRSFRWQWMLKVTTVQETRSRVPSLEYLFGIYAISWSINCLVPAKLGDGYRAYRLKQDDDVSYSLGFGTIVSERIYDLGALVALLIVSGLLAFRGNMPSEATEAVYLGIVLTALILVGLLVMWLGRAHILRRVPSRFQSTYTTFQNTLFMTLRRPILPFGLAFLIWLAEGGRVFFVCQSVSANVSFEIALFVALISALLTTLPFTPAGLGVVEIAIITALKFVDVPADVAGAVALLDRFITYWLVILVGLVSYLVMARKGKSESVPVVPERTPTSTS